MLSPCKSIQSALGTSIPGIQFMKDECKRLLKYVDVLMNTADAVKGEYWKSKNSKESLSAMQAILLDCQTLIVECRGKKEGFFTNKKKWSKRFENLQSGLNDLDTRFSTLLLVSFTNNIIVIY